MAKFFHVSPIGANNPGAIERFDTAATLSEKNLDAVEQAAVKRWRSASKETGRYLPISWFGGTSALAAGESGRAVRYFEAARTSAGQLSDERAAAGFMHAIVLRDLGRDSENIVSQKRLVEAEVLAASDFPSSAVKQRVHAGILALAGRRDEALNLDARALERSTILSPLERVYWEPLPPASDVWSQVQEKELPGRGLQRQHPEN